LEVDDELLADEDEDEDVELHEERQGFIRPAASERMPMLASSLRALWSVSESIEEHVVE